MRSELQVSYQKSKENPAVIKFFVTGTVNGVAVRAETRAIHSGLHFVGRSMIDLFFVQSHTNVFRAEGGRATYGATRAVNESILAQIGATKWRNLGNLYPASLVEHVPTPNEDEFALLLPIESVLARCVKTH